MSEKKNIDISKYDYGQLIHLYINNKELPINSGLLFLTLREFHKHIESSYFLIKKPNIISRIKNLFKNEKVNNDIKDREPTTEKPNGKQDKGFLQRV